MTESVTPDLGFQPCDLCRQLVHQARHPDRYVSTIPGELGVRMNRDSARQWFGTHVGEAHPSAVAPELTPDACGACREMELYLVVEGPDVEYPDITGRLVTGAEIVRRHQLSHLIDLMPEPDAA